MNPKITRAIPQLPYLDLIRTKDYYQNKLGCKLFREKDDFLIFQLDDMEIHLWKCDDERLPENSSCYFRVNDIDGMYKKYKDVKGINVVVSLQMQPWGLKEFYLCDDSGNLLKFGQERGT